MKGSGNETYETGQAVTNNWMSERMSELSARLRGGATGDQGATSNLIKIKGDRQG